LNAETMGTLPPVENRRLSTEKSTVDSVVNNAL
jgi:hypothetical protein